MNSNSNIVIMGPIAVGKSSVAQELARELGRSRVELDEERERIYSQSDFSAEEMENHYSSEGIVGWYNYQKPYELLSVAVVLAENSNAVIDFGGGQSVYDDEKQAEEFLRLMEPVENSFLLMPYVDTEASIALLRARIGRDEATLNKIFVPSKTSRLAAKHIIYTERKTVKEIVTEIIPLVK